MVAFNRSTKDVVDGDKTWLLNTRWRQKAILKDVLSIQMLLKSYAENKTGNYKFYKISCMQLL